MELSGGDLRSTHAFGLQIPSTSTQNCVVTAPFPFMKFERQCFVTFISFHFLLMGGLVSQFQQSKMETYLKSL